ncbi:MAG: hypothetical protein Q8P22_08450 [Chloroflexota bacterium]|nr:hypothetical protein [Chloroflexota bacterium]
MRRILFSIAAAFTVVLGLAACAEEGDEAGTASPTATVARTATPAATKTPEATATRAPATPAPATATPAPPTPELATSTPPASGHASPEEAVVQWARRQCTDPFCGWEYAGDCSSTAAEEGGKFCSSLFGGSDSQLVYTVGPTQSQWAKWLLLEQQADGTWLVVDSAVVQETLEPPKPPWPMAGGP